MGLSVAPSLRADGARRLSVFLFDKATGGSGFASAAEHDLPGLLKAASERLDCPADCESGCPECVLRRDVQYTTGNLDRRGALETLTAEILPRLSLPDDLRLFGERTQAITRPLTEWCLRQAAKGDLDRLKLFLTDRPADWDIMDWPGVRALIEARKAGAKVSLVLRWKDINALEMSQKLDLLRLVARSDASLHALDELPSVAGRLILAEAEINESAYAFIAASDNARHIDRNWGIVSEDPILSGEREATPTSGALSVDKLAIYGEGNSAQHDIAKELDGPIGGFGTGFWKIVRKLRPQAFNSEKRLISLTYNDRYLRTPLTARLLVEVIEKMPSRSEATKIEIVSESAGHDGRSGYLLHHGWESDALRQAVLEALLPGVAVRLVAKSDCAHARFIQLHFDDDSVLTIFLDQGFGAWRAMASRPLRFDQSLAPAQQARELRRMPFDIGLQDNARIPSPVWVRW
ncbi:MAG: DUF1998 domain-containing protein [Rhodovulum sp.]